MGLLRDMETRARAEELGHPNSGDPVLVNWFGNRASHSGVSFDADGALSWTALNRGVRLSSVTIGSLPWDVLEKRGRVREPRDEHGVHWLMHHEPNPEQTPMEFLEGQQAHSLWWGASYAEIVRNGFGMPVELWPINPDRVSAWRDEDDDLWWRIAFADRRESRMIPARDMLVVKGFGTHGLIGQRLYDVHRGAIGLGIATEIFTESFFGAGANISGFVSHPKVLGDVARDNLQKSLSKKFEGLTNTHRVRLLEEGMTWHPTGIDPEKAQLILGRKFQILEAARILDTAPHLLYDLERATFSNIEHQSLEYVRDHVRPWVTRREQRCNKQLFGRKERGRVYVKANLAGLMRGDMKTTMETLVMGIQNRIYTPNQARETLDLNPGPAILDEYQRTPNLFAPSEQPEPASPKEVVDDDEVDRITA